MLQLSVYRTDRDVSERPGHLCGTGHSPRAGYGQSVVSTVGKCMAGETGGTGRDLPLRAPSIPIPGWDPRGPIYNENGPFLLILDCFSAISIVVGIGGFGPFETPGDPFLGGNGKWEMFSVLNRSCDYE